MRKDFFDNHEELCDYMIDRAQDGFYTVAVLFYKDAIALIRELMMFDDIDVEALDIRPPEYSGYDKEYYVSLADDLILSVEPVFVDNRYLDAEADLTLVDGNASSVILKHIHENKCHEIYIGENYDSFYECTDDCKKCVCYDNNYDILINEIFENAKLIKDINGNPTGIKINIQSIFDYLLK